MSLLERIEQIQKTWSVMLPYVPKPQPAWLGRWCEAPDEVVEHALIRASKRYPSAETFNGNPELVWRYITGIIKSETLRRLALAASITAPVIGARNI